MFSSPSCTSRPFSLYVGCNCILCSRWVPNFDRIMKHTSCQCGTSSAQSWMMLPIAIYQCVTLSKTIPENQMSSQGNSCLNLEHEFIHISSKFATYRPKKSTYFCSTKRGSKNSVVILLAYREQPVMEHSPGEWQQESTTVSTASRPLWTISFARMWLLTWQDEHDPSQTGNFRFGFIWAPDFGTLHAKECKDGAEEAQADSSDHKSSACLDVTCN